MSDIDRVRLRLDRVRAAVGEIDPAFLDTPALPCAPLSQALGCSVTLKVETLNPFRSSRGRRRDGRSRGARTGGMTRGIADGVAGRRPIPEVLDDLLVVLDDVMLVREGSIKVGMRMLYEHAGLVVEPSAALGVAAVLEEPERFAGRRVTTILCGSNVDPADFARWVLEPVAS